MGHVCLDIIPTTKITNVLKMDLFVAVTLGKISFVNVIHVLVTNISYKMNNVMSVLLYVINFSVAVTNHTINVGIVLR